MLLPGHVDEYAQLRSQGFIQQPLRWREVDANAVAPQAAHEREVVAHLLQIRQRLAGRIRREGAVREASCVPLGRAKTKEFPGDADAGWHCAVDGRARAPAFTKAA